MKLDRMLVVVLCVSIVELFNATVHAQKNDSSQKAIVTTVHPGVVESCIKNFSIEKVNLSDPRLVGYLPYLKEYVMCRAGQEDSSDCFDLVFADKPMFNRSKSYFNSHQAFFGRVLMAKNATSAALTACMAKGGEFTRENCKNVAEGLLRQDSSKCNVFTNEKNRQNCQDLIAGGRQASTYAYINALRDGRPSSCEQVPSVEGQWLCRGVLDKSPGACERNKGFDIFRRNYCEIMSQDEVKTK